MNQTNNDYLILTIYDKKMASGIMRGRQTYEELTKKYTHVYDQNTFDNLLNKNPNTDLLKLKTVVFIFKWCKIPKWVSTLNKPYVIWDIVDGLNHLKPNRKAGVVKNVLPNYKTCKGYRSMYNLCNLINCANSKQMEILSSINPNKKTFDCIPHNWDNRTRDKFQVCKKNLNLDKPYYVFVGTAQQKFDSKFRKFYKFRPIANKLVNDKLLGTFNVCGSFRTADISIPKPGTKCAVAASMNCIFIANRDEYGVFDLLGDRYPYYFSGVPTKKKIKKLIDYIDKTYKSQTWDLAMECINNAKIKSDVITTTNNFIKHFTEYFKN